jgi:hypothetical protein
MAGTLHVQLHDPFGTVIAEGDLTIPRRLRRVGEDDFTPSVADEIASRLTGHRLSLNVPDIDPRMLYSITVT